MPARCEQCSQLSERYSTGLDGLVRCTHCFHPAAGSATSSQPLHNDLAPMTSPASQPERPSDDGFYIRVSEAS